MAAVVSDSKRIFLLLLLSIFIILLDSRGLFYFPKNVLQYITVPIQYGLFVSSKSTTQQIRFVINSRVAAKENSALQKQMADLLIENAKLRKQLSETNAVLGQQTSISPQTFNLLAARPVGQGRYLQIDKGANDGVVRGQVVIFQDSFIGTIVTVQPNSSLILLPYDPNSKVSVYSQNAEGRSKGILQGQYGSQVIMNKILHKEPIDVTDLVYTDGSDGTIPKGLIVGTITSVYENPNEIFKVAQVKPIYSITDLDIVFVMRN
jgi:rod shape-determining protein MreC